MAKIKLMTEKMDRSAIQIINLRITTQRGIKMMKKNKKERVKKAMKIRNKRSMKEKRTDNINEQLTRKITLMTIFTIIIQKGVEKILNSKLNKSNHQSTKLLNGR